MAGAMRRMGIYLGLVEDDDARGYGRHDARQPEQVDRDRRYGRYAADDHYDEHYADDDYAAGYDDDLDAPEIAPVRDPEPLSVRRVAPARPLGLAPAGGRSADAGSSSV